MASGAPDPKTRLRREMEARRGAVAPERAWAAAEAVARELVEAARERSVRRFALYAAIGGELPSRPLFEALAAFGRPRLMPRLRGDALEWAPVENWDLLRPGRFGIPEPQGAAVAAPGPGDWVLLPGLAFDTGGARLGRGGGFYDRAFPEGAPAPLLVGVGYAFQCVPAVPRLSHDRGLDAIVTEAGFVWRREGE